MLLLVAGVTASVQAGTPTGTGMGTASLPASGPDRGSEEMAPPVPDDERAQSGPQPLDLAASGYELPGGASVYAARVVEGDGSGAPRYVDYMAGGGAFDRDFWPASSIKLLAALGALDFAASLGYTGAATVSFETGYSWTLREIYESAVLVSDNADYDMLIRIAGFDRLNADFLSPANGFPTTVIQRSYAGIDVRWSPEMVLEEGGRSTVVPARDGTGEYDCPDEGNCTDLFELSEAVRRLVLDRSLSAEERFAISPSDVDALSDAMAGAGSYFSDAAMRVLGPGATVRGKPGVAPGLDCVETAVITSSAGDSYLLGATMPDDGFDEECSGLGDLAEAVLSVLASP